MCAFILWVVGCLLAVQATEAQCPWDHQVSDLQSSCICAYNLMQQLSVQCDMVDFPQLIRALDKFGRTMSIDLLYVNNSSVKALVAGGLRNLKLTNLQLSSCRIKTVAPGAFDGLHPTLKNLYLQDNELEEVPIEALRGLKNLTTLDLSKNKITRITDNAFATLTSLTTLKLAENNLTISRHAFNGLESSLKNLNLKATRQKRVPEAVRGLRTLAFLDLAQNGLRELPGPGIGAPFDGLHSLTALNLERNVIQTVGDEAFTSIADTLSSLSLLNNLLTEFPTEALRPLSELRVLDIGFNLLTELPLDAFLGNPSLTLLALDGNPLSTIPGPAIAHLNSTLRGLSLGGRFLHCDCRIRWVAQWIRRGDLQVTSRERNPQFCGSPPRFTDLNFYNIEPEDLVCPTNKQAPAVDEAAEETVPSEIGVGVGYVEPATTPASLPQVPPRTLPPTVFTSVTTTTTTQAPITTTTPSTTTTTTTTTTTERPTTKATPRVTQKINTSTGHPARRGSVVLSRSTPWPSQGGRPPLVLGHHPRTPQDVIVRNAQRLDNSVIIQWDSETANILGFRVVYRLFGDKSFKQGPPLEASEREFKIKNVPSQECIVVCVVSLEEINVAPETVPYSQCREVRTVSSPTNNMDKITIAASAAICGTVVIAVIIFVATSRRRSRKLHTLEGHHSKMGLPVGGLPVACCPASSPGPLSSLATLNAFTSHKDWDQVSVYSNRSLSRGPRMYHVERQGSTRRDW
ncbi:leucine-rich repeat and fibronectin type-III domain-containing protein hattifattener isoform X2 [Rhodnius prolixus]|uniref:leucine-rich repeat and fibronectin type-III domain-containing protein hattifattener isoform X2 n=1 Tax=Rhodnius prolixus TaxID=13249 RepID=UPI003D189B68